MWRNKTIEGSINILKKLLAMFMVFINMFALVFF